MFTVVICEQEHLDSIVEYEAFLKPFLTNKEIAFCRWNTDGESIKDMVPDLYATVSRHQQWRMVVVCDEEGIQKRNPFDLVEHHDPEDSVESGETASDEYYQARREARVESYARAAKKPLVKLTTWLCRSPLVSSRESLLGETDPELREYLAQHWAKEDIRKELVGDYVPEISLPSQILCVAKRCYDLEQESIDDSWRIRYDSNYSKFYDYNLYFDNMRYLVFDILPHHHRNYIVDYLRFLYALMLLADNDVPLATLAPNRVYALDCQNDEEVFGNILQSYDNKLSATIEDIRAQYRRIQNEEKPRLSDHDAETMFRSDMPVPMAPIKGFNISSLFVSHEDVGLSTDCPTKEDVQWKESYQDSRKSLGRYLKLPRRILKKTASELHRINKANLEDAGRLNEFQVEDVEDYVADQERKMVELHTSDVYDASRYYKDMETQNKRINTVIERRMTKKWTITLACVALACYVVGFLPMFISNFKAENGTLFSLIFFAAGAALMALTAFVTLFFLRYALKAAYGDYNGIMRRIVTEVEGSLTEYSKYFGHACNVMRGYSVLNYCAETEDPDAAKLRILKKHELDVLCVREEFREVFGIFLPEKHPDLKGVEGYSYDFLRPVEYKYQMPFNGTTGRKIEFLQKGNFVEVPIDFVKSMSVRREELYD